MRRVLIVGAAVVIAAGGAAMLSAAGAGGSSEHSPVPLRPWGFGFGSADPPAAVPHIKRARLLSVRAHTFTAASIDNDPAGTSQGDELAVEGLLTGRDGRSVGRLEAHEVFTGLGPNGGRLEVVFTALLAHGQISGIGVINISNAGASNAKAAIVGGTGRYRNARGTVIIHPAGQSTHLTFLLVP